jgi:hypothetical protein
MSMGAITELKKLLEGITQEEYEQPAAIADFKRSKTAATRLKIQGLIQQIINETKSNNAANGIALRMADSSSISEKIQLIDKLAEIYVGVPKRNIGYLPHDIR